MTIDVKSFGISFAVSLFFSGCPVFPSGHFILLLVFYPLVTLANNSLALLLFAGTIKWATGCSGGAVDKDGVIRKMFVHRVHSDMKNAATGATGALLTLPETVMLCRSATRS